MIRKISLTAFILVLLIMKSCTKDPLVKIGSDSFAATPYTLVHQPWYPPFNLPIDNPLTEEGVMLGRMLFHDPIMSGDSTMSCATCHRQNKGFSDPRKVSQGITGELGNRNAMPLHNLMWNHLFFWDGRAKSIREQVLIPIQAHNEMNLNLFTLVKKLSRSPRYQTQFKKAFNTNEIDPQYIAKGLEQFLVTMISFNAPIDKLWNRTDTLNVIDVSALRGLNLFMRPTQDGGADCFHCHSNIPFFGITSVNGSMSNNGLDEVFTDKGFGSITGRFEDMGKFKIPSLRNVAVTAPYMHDSRFSTLEEVIDFYSDNIKFKSPNLDVNIASHNAQLNLNIQQKADLVEFLKTLTDTSYLNNPAFKSPF
ncbi:MAG: cytochrome c peroxidase [bacterium]|nr:cytochrome c peroxidase [bacterium]